MKEISKLSELMKDFILDIEKKMERENKDVKVYDVWDEIMKKEGMTCGVSLEDVRKSTLIVYVRHSGMAQQIRWKTKKILSAFNEKLSGFKVNKITIMLKDELKDISSEKYK